MRRRLLLLSTLVVLASAPAFGIKAAFSAVPRQTTDVSSARQAPACGGPPCGAGISVLKGGTGSGTVTSDPAGIDCGATCSSGFSWGRSVTLSATSAAGSAFTGWSAGCPGLGTCEVRAGAGPSGARPTVTASFTLISRIPNTLRVSVNDAGYAAGRVTSVPAGIDCGATCVSEYPGGTSVGLRAIPYDGSTFTGWSGACAGTGRCHVTIGAKKGVAVTATFSPECAVPRVKGMTLRAAERWIKSQQCSVGRITREASRTVRKRHVISQKPRAGTQLEPGARVNLVVSEGGS